MLLRQGSPEFVEALKRFRRIALRCEKTLPAFMGLVHLACAMTWLRRMQTRSRGRAHRRFAFAIAVHIAPIEHRSDALADAPGRLRLAERDGREDVADDRAFDLVHRPIAEHGEGVVFDLLPFGDRIDAARDSRRSSAALARASARVSTLSEPRPISRRFPSIRTLSIHCLKPPVATRSISPSPST